ncbi:MAG: inositol phosphorylceramide synthase [Ruminococcaceae bacterium]|nr:inositol phosphorylceramide synthase [Oscillospiraceae bacterium]
MWRLIKDGFINDTWWSRLMVASLYLLSTLIYLQTNRLTRNTDLAVVWKWPIDDRLPFLPLFVLPYCAWFVLVAAVFFWLIFDHSQNRRIYRHTAGVLLAMLLSALIFLVFPTHVPRPPVRGNDLVSRLLLLIYASDEPYNCFPSLHVAIAALKGITLFRYGPAKIWFRALITILVVLIMLSTVLIRQHYTPDLAGGLALAWLCDRLARLIIPERLVQLHS